MATNTGASKSNSRTAVRWLRDGIKSNYVKAAECACCGCTTDLELHHYNTVSIILKNYCSEHGIPIDTDEEVLAMRDDFYKAYWHELVEHTVTLCATHHKALHKIYGREPALSTASKQENWVNRVHGRLSGKDATPSSPNNNNRFSRLI